MALIWEGFSWSISECFECTNINAKLHRIESPTISSLDCQILHGPPVAIIETLICDTARWEMYIDLSSGFVRAKYHSTATP